MSENTENEKPAAQARPLDRFYASEPSALLRSEESAVRIILHQFSKISTKAVLKKPQDKSSLTDPGRKSAHLPDTDVERPHNVFLLDGGRGAGKTYTLQSVEHAMNRLSELCRDNSEADTTWANFFFKTGRLDGPDALREAVRQTGGTVRAADCMRIIFPGDLMDGESVMESIFAQMANNLEEMSQRLKNNGLSVNAQDADDLQANKDKLEEVRKLSNDLRTEVAQGWYFARRFGLDAIIRDSLDYPDLVASWANESKRSSFRIDKWRSFVSKYLDARNRAVLVVLVDDSDVKPETTEDVLHAIRMFLNHPRIVTVLAGNLKSMRDTLLYRAMDRIGPSVSALNKNGSPTAKDWRKRERQLIEEYLEKVIPPSHRIHIGRAYTPDVKLGGDVSGPGSTPVANRELADSFRKITDASLSEIVNVAQQRFRGPFLDAKFKLAIERELGNVDAPSPRERDRLEGFLAWWFFASVYRDGLAPHSARQIATFGEYYEEFAREAFEIRKARQKDGAAAPTPDKRPPSVRTKRLPVMLFDHPSNYSLIQRLSDEDSSLPEWLRAQELSSIWRDRRTMTINGREVHQSTYTYRYLSYRLDVGLAMPLRDNTDTVMPKELLPNPIGRQFMRRFFQPRLTPRRHRRLGICKAIDHAVIPGNCVYVHQLQALPDIIFTPSTLKDEAFEAARSGVWEAQLADKWFELLDDRDEPTNDEGLKRYFREIVCEGLRGTENLSSAVLISELDPPDLLRKQQYSIYEHFLADELGLMSANPLERQEILLRPIVGLASDQTKAYFEALKSRIASDAGDAADATKKNAKKGTSSQADAPIWRRAEDLHVDTDGAQRPPKAPVRLLALYAALATDLRRAWIAARIYEAAPKFSSQDELEAETETGRRASLAVLGNRDRMTLFTRKDIQELLERSDWLKSMLTVFTKENLDWSLGQTTNAGKSPAQIEVRRLFSPHGSIVNKLQPVEEPEDFKLWTITLRNIGRRVCKNWPVGDGELMENFDYLNVEDNLFEGANAAGSILKIFQPREGGSSSSGKSDSERREQYEKELDTFKRNARSARNLVWFLYGIAPSLPAVIHAHIMSIVYEAELNWQVLFEMRKKNISDAPAFVGDPEQREKMIAKVVENYRSALGEIQEWAKLIGSLAAILRYIKIKCLHLDVALTLDRIVPVDKAGRPSHTTVFKEPDAQSASATFERTGYSECVDSDRDRMRKGLIELCGFETTRTPDLRGNAEEERKKKQAEFDTQLGKDAQVVAARLDAVFRRRKLSTGLAIFPDVAPSTLFGDKWIQDIFSRNGLNEIFVGEFDDGETCLRKLKRKQSTDADDAAATEPPTGDDDPLSVNGIFGETEQWLWASNRTLRKLDNVLRRRAFLLVGLPEEFNEDASQTSESNGTTSEASASERPPTAASQLGEAIAHWEKPSTDQAEGKK